MNANQSVKMLLKKNLFMRWPQGEMGEVTSSSLSVGLRAILRHGETSSANTHGPHSRWHLQVTNGMHSHLKEGSVTSLLLPPRNQRREH